MELPKTESGNKYVIVLQDLFTKWPLVFPLPDQKSLRVAKLLAEEVVPHYGVPEVLLTDRGANLLSHLVLDLCNMLGIRKLNMTAYDPQCDGLVERFKRFEDHDLEARPTVWYTVGPGLLWAYRNVSHEATGEKTSFLLYGYDCSSPTEAALFLATPCNQVHLDGYH